MTPREYLRYTDELKVNGYEYRKDCPDDGRGYRIREGEKIICRGEIKKRLGVSVKTINHFKIIHYGK